ncbi:hypothetical protein ACS0TY_035332 [Phlomoides rotata]
MMLRTEDSRTKTSTPGCLGWSRHRTKWRTFWTNGTTLLSSLRWRKINLRMHARFAGALKKELTPDPLPPSWRDQSTSLIDLGEVHGRDRERDILVNKLMGNGGSQDESGIQDLDLCFRSLTSVAKGILESVGKGESILGKRFLLVLDDV